MFSKKLLNIPNVVLPSTNQECSSRTIVNQNKPKLENVTEWLNKSFDTSRSISNQNLFTTDHQHTKKSELSLELIENPNCYTSNKSKTSRQSTEDTDDLNDDFENEVKNLYMWTKNLSVNDVDSI